MAALKEDLSKLVQQDVRGDVDPEKVYQYSQARRFELYDRGKQYLVPTVVNNQIADWSPLTGTLKSGVANEGGSGRYDHVVNVLRGDKKKFNAVLGQRLPVIKCMPDRMDDEVAMRQSRRADLEARKLYFEWELERQQRQLANSLWKTTTVFGYTAWVSDAAKHGTVEEPSFEMQDQELAPGGHHCMQCGADVPVEQAQGGECPQCGAPLGWDTQVPPETASVPTPGASKTYAKGAVEFALCTVFEVTAPFYAKTVDDLPWLLYEYDEHKGRILGLYPQMRQKLLNDELAGNASGSASSQGTMARDTASSPTGSISTARKNRTLYTRIWLQPLMYELMRDEQKRKMLSENFKTGCKITLVADEIVDIEEEKLAEHWSYCKPDVSEYIFADPVCADFIGLQDLINDMHNIQKETWERAIPWFLFDPMVLDPVQMRKHALLPGEGVPAKAGVGAQLSNSIWKAPVATVDAQMPVWTAGLHETGREITGVLPAIFGASSGPEKTAREAELNRNQALMQLGLIWSEMRTFWARVMENGIRLKSKYGAAFGGDEEGDPEEQLASLAELADGKWHCETEEAMPMTWGQRRDFYMFLLDKGPAAWQMLGMQEQNNLPAIQQAMGMEDWKVPGIDQRDKVYAVIGQLVKGAPTMDPTTGKVEPSIPIDVFEDDHMACAAMTKQWCLSDRGRTVKETSPQGYANVVAWGMAHMELTMPDPGMGGPGPGMSAGDAGGGTAAAPSGPEPALPPSGGHASGMQAHSPAGAGLAPGPSKFAGAGNKAPQPLGAAQ